MSATVAPRRIGVQPLFLPVFYGVADFLRHLPPRIEYSDRTVTQLIQTWRTAVKSNLKRSTQASYEWAFKRIEAALGRFPVSGVEKSEVQGFQTAAGERASESVHDLRARLRGLFSLAEE